MAKLSLAKLERHLYSAADRLRQEGLDAATYKDYIFGLLFLKRCSDVFDAERERIVGHRVERGMIKEVAETQYGENPDFYEGFFVPERARWDYLQSKLGDATEPYGSVLDKALGALSEANESLEHVLDHISFMRVQGNKRIVSDDACKDLVRHFSRYRLRNEDFQFADLLGAAYEFLINMFAESAGKKGGDFYTPRDVIRLMVRILKPRPGLSIYDPTCGSGGMLIISREFVEQSGGDPTDLRLCGQVNDASAWSICKLNMLLHGVPGADIRLEDTLLHPQHREAGELERFDRVIANPPFSQNYTRNNMEYPERFRWGWCPTTGKKGDLMFAQHMLAVCKPGGMVITVMPHGVLFRGGAEKEIRRKFLQEDLIEAIISLPPNLFYGAGIPACILVMRPNLTGRSPNPNKPANRRGQVLFINADAEFHAGRAQNYLRPEHVEKIVSTFDRFEDVPGYARRVPLAEISDPANDWNLNIRRYVDNSPPSEPHDVRAHMLGGVPVAELEAKRALFDALGFDITHAFTPRERDPRYCDFAPTLTERTALRPLVEHDPGVQARAQALREALTAWWTAHAPRLADLPQHRALNRVRAEFLEGFVAALQPLTVLDRFKLAGVIATWWTDTLLDFKTLLENGFPGVIDGWIDAIADAVEDDEAAGPAFDPFGHKLVRRTMADYLEQIAEARADIARFKGEKEAFEQSNAPEDADEEELATWNYAKDLDRQMKELKADNRDALRELAKRQRAAARARATTEEKRAAAEAKAALQPVFDQLVALEAALAPYEQIKADLAAARARYRELTDAFVDQLRARCGIMREDEKRTLILELFAQDVQAGLDVAVSERRQELMRFVEGLWDKYRITLTDLQTERATIGERLGGNGDRARLLMSMRDWDEIRIEDLGDIIAGGTPSRGNPSYWNGRIPWVTPTEITELRDKYLRETRERITDEGLAGSAAKLLPPGSVLVTTRATLGEAAIAAVPVATNQGFKSIIPNTASHSLFTYYLIRSLKSEMERLASGTTFLEISKADFSRIKVRRPKHDEQTRIAAVLDTMDEAIAKTEAVIAKLRQVRAGLLHDLLTYGLDEYGQLRDPIAHPEQFQDSPLGRIPREWKIVFVDDLCSQVVDCPYSTPTYVLDGIPCIRTADMLPGQLLRNQAYKVTEETYYERTARLVPREGDIIYSREGERLGIASPVGPERVCLGQRVMHLRPKPETDTDYLVWAMNAPLFYRQVLVRIGATTSPHINVGDIRKFSLLRPPPTEQRLIGQTFRACEGLIRTDEAHLAKYQVVKQGLMADLLTGRVRVPESVMAVENQP